MDIQIAPATLADLKYVDHLQRKNAEELAFYPMVVFEREVENARLILARVNGEPAGYIYHGALNAVVKIHQACIEYDLRGQLYGSALIRWLMDVVTVAGGASIKLRCGSDIEANQFWSMMGFYCQSVTAGGVRRMRDINEWRMDLQPQLFVTTSDPSRRAQDASIWRAGKSGDKSQFIRGKDITAYREEVIARAALKHAI